MSSSKMRWYQRSNCLISCLTYKFLIQLRSKIRDKRDSRDLRDPAKNPRLGAGLKPTPDPDHTGVKLLEPNSCILYLKICSGSEWKWRTCVRLSSAEREELFADYPDWILYVLSLLHKTCFCLWCLFLHPSNTPSRQRWKEKFSVWD